MKKILLLLSFILLSCGHSIPNESDAKEASRAALLQRVKNPMDVTFFQNEKVLDLGDGNFQYNETISATNGFGGTITQNAIVKVKWLKDDPSEVSNWTVIDFQLNDR
ncbi:hypothetical protein [Flavobacterium geliluteum]|uniref:Lipoprotein n=1 Tax=Flavobacterium geliluteum TaxID=2816120 RepID=A0A941B0D2_9FLAO|nr:hypothetical protein [Flavobacterium geliluteum]MBP4140037.1 hypothetical protein [Flavobacterium geliluteum]